MRETEVIKEWMEDYLRPKVDQLWFYKIHDSRFTGKKPFDVCGTYKYYKMGEQSTALALEFKLHKSLETFNLSKVIDFQVKSLEDFFTAGGDARVVLAIKFMLSQEDKEKFNYPTRRVNIWIDWPILDFLRYRDTHKSVNVRDLIGKGISGFIHGNEIE